MKNLGWKNTISGVGADALEPESSGVLFCGLDREGLRLPPQEMDQLCSVKSWKTRSGGGSFPDLARLRLRDYAGQLLGAFSHSPDSPGA